VKAASKTGESEQEYIVCVYRNIAPILGRYSKSQLFETIVAAVTTEELLDRKVAATV
jgi:hypothetical protein